MGRQVKTGELLAAKAKPASACVSAILLRLPFLSAVRHAGLYFAKESFIQDLSGMARMLKGALRQYGDLFRFV